MLSEHDTPGVKPSSSSLKLEKAVDVAPLSSASTGTEEDPATGGPRTSSTSEAKATDALLPGLSNTWFTASATEDLLNEQVAILGYPVWNASVIQDGILELSSHERRIDSVIRSKVIVKKDLLYTSAPRVFELSDTVEKAVLSAQCFQKRINSFRQGLVSRCLVVPWMLLAQRRIAKTMLVLSVLRELLYWQTLAQTHITHERYEAATSALMTFQRLLFQHHDLLQHYPTALCKAVTARATASWTTLYQNLLGILDNTLRDCCTSSKRGFHSRALERCLRALYFFRSKESCGTTIIESFARNVPDIARRRLFEFLDPDWQVPKSPAVADIAVVDLCQHISAGRIPDSIQAILKLFLDVWVAYAEVILWAKKRSRALDHQLEEQEKPNGICAVSASKDANHGDISNLEFVAFLRTIVGDMNQEKQQLWDRQEQYVLLITQSLITACPTLPIHHFFKVFAMLHRFCLEVYAILYKKTAQWETAVAFQDMQLPSSLENLPYFTKVSDFLTHLSRLYFRSFLTRNMSRLRVFLVEDSWQRLPLLNKHTHDLLTLPEHPPPSPTLLDLALFDNATYPGYCTRCNSFSHWEPSETWTRRWSFLLQPIKYDGLASLKCTESFEDCSYRDGVVSLEISDYGPVLSASTRQIIHTINGCVQFGFAFPFLRTELVAVCFLLLDIVIFSTVFFFSSSRKRDALLASYALPSASCSGAVLREKHRGFLFQRPLKKLRHIVDAFCPLLTAPLSAGSASIASKCLLPVQPERDVGLEELLKQQLELVASTFHGFVPDPFPKLDSPGALWGLSERVTAVESCVTLLSLLHHVFQFHELDGSTPKAVPGNCVNVFVPFFSEANAVPLAKTWVSLRKEAVAQLREFIYAQAAETLFDLEPFIDAVSRWKWDVECQDLGLSVDQLRLQLQDLSRRIACCGAGSISHRVQLLLWQNIGQHSVKACVLGMARNTQHFPTADASGCPPPSLVRLCHVFRDFLLIVSSQIKKTFKSRLSEQHNGKEDSLAALNEHQTFLNTTYLDSYIQGHSLRGAAAFAWCTMQTEYDIFMLTQLLQKTEPDLSARKIAIADLELSIATLLHEAT